MPELYAPQLGFYVWLLFAVCITQAFGALHRFGKVGYAVIYGLIAFISFNSLQTPHL